MTRKKLAIAILLLMLFSLFSGAAGAEEPALATPTDLECMHVRTKTTIYFIDSPLYIPGPRQPLGFRTRYRGSYL